MVTGGLFNIGITAQIFLVASGFDLATRDSYFTIQFVSFLEPYFSRTHVFH